MATLFDQPDHFADAGNMVPPDPCPYCGEERELYAGAGQAFCIRCEFSQAEEAERVYRQTDEFRTRFPHFHTSDKCLASGRRIG